MSRLSGATVTVHSLVGAAQVELALKCLGSLVAAVPFPIRLVLHDDGTSARPDARGLTATWGRMRVRRSAAGRRACPRAAAGPSALRPFSRRAPLRAETFRRAAAFNRPRHLRGYRRALDSSAGLPGLLRRSGGAGLCRHARFQEAYAVRLRTGRGCGAGYPAREPLLRGDHEPRALRRWTWIMSSGSWALTRRDLFGGFRFWAEQTIYAALAARAGLRLDRPGASASWRTAEFCRAPRAAIIHFAGFSRGLFADAAARSTPPLVPAPRTKILATQPTPACGLGRRCSAPRARGCFCGTLRRADLRFCA